MRELFRSWRSDLVIEITERPVSCLGGTPETCAARAEYRVTRAEMDVMRELIIEVASGVLDTVDGIAAVLRKVTRERARARTFRRTEGDS